MASDNLLNFAGVAERLGLSPRTVKKMLAARVLPIVKLGRRILVRPSDLDRYIEQHVEKPVGSKRGRRGA